LVSAELDGVSLRAATWWAVPRIYSTTATTEITCWDGTLHEPGPVQIATSGEWADTKFGLTGGYPGSNFNHAKIGVSTPGSVAYVIFGDLNQQGATSQKCSSSQNGRGGLFYVLAPGSYPIGHRVKPERSRVPGFLRCQIRHIRQVRCHSGRPPTTCGRVDPARRAKAN
jgi:hypothetical protein